LLLNGGSENEQLHVDVVVPSVREPRCLGSHSVDAGKFVVLDIERPTRSVPLRVRIVGGPQPIVLDERRAPLRIPVGRLAAAAALAIGLGSLLTIPGGLRSSVVPRAAIHHLAALPHVRPRIALHPRALHPRIAAAPAPAAPAIVLEPSVPPPTVAVSAASHVFRGQPIDVSFRTTGAQVHIIAQIGPRRIADRIIAASNGTVQFKAPPSADVRVLTIAAEAQKDDRSSRRLVIVILLPDAPPKPIPPVTNL
jgi:hypothetical protein